MKSIDYEDWETDEPPVLGEADKLNNQVVVESVKLQGESIMDEMVAVAQRAKEDKRKQQDRERNHKSFGRGLKKGFFNTAKPARTKKAATAKSASILEPIQQQSRHDRLLIVKEQKEEAAATANPTFVFPEVQEAMKSMNQLDPKEWMNARFFEKLARNPKLAQALQNPAFTNAIAEMQQDPHAAILKYQKDPAVSKMLRDFMEFLGSHFEELGSSEGSASSQRPSVKQQQQFEEDPLVENNQPSTASTPASKTPAIVDLDETRRQAIAGMQRTPEEEEQVQRISKNPELLAALSDGSLMQRLHACQQSPGELQRLAQDPVLGPKLRLLVQHNMVQFAS
ncbi:Plectin-like protein [Phytophthora cinnamomi]|uniref:Plectin-like protein n=1 Tax=Phytophthora cinnamomi TaxID=4785 RepID=UPI00355A4339|nr:Plectin-like protein [Phytophthora cinnamomi]